MSGRRLRAIVLGVGLVRVGAGIALAGAPSTFLRWERDIPPGSSMALLLRTVGIRDLALGLGTLLSAGSAPTTELQRWIGAGFVSDTLDIAAGLVSARRTGVRGVVSSLVALPVAALDVWALSELAALKRATPD